MEKKLILVIEDDAAILDSVKTLLEMEGFEVLCAHDGQEGLDILRTIPHLPHLILLDLMMPIKDGFEFRKDQLLHSNLACIPVIVMTAEGHHSSRKDQLNANAILKKPIDIDQMITTIRECISNPGSKLGKLHP